jgi:amino acid adenylation domain-containing protein
MTQKKYALTSPQREIWFDQILHPAIPLYNRGRCLKILGDINPVLLTQAVNYLVKKHDTLRLKLSENDNGLPEQRICPKIVLKVPLKDFTDKKDPDNVAQEWMLNRLNEPFQLRDAILFRVDLIKIGDERYYLLMQYHHLITDGYTNTLLTRSLADIYTSLAQQKKPDLTAPSYTDFIAVDADHKTLAVREQQRDYWLKKYSQVPKPLFRPRYHLRSNDKFIGSQLASFKMPRAFYQRLHTLGKHYQTTLFRVLLAVFYVYFTRTEQRADFTIGVPTLNRPTTEFKKSAGLFTLINPAHFSFEKTMTFSELLQKIDHSLKKDLAHQPFPSSEISRVVNQGNHNASLFDISLSYLRFDSHAPFDDIHSETSLLPNLSEQSPLSIYIQDFHPDREVKFDFIYNLRYFNATDITTLQTRLFSLLKTVLEESERPICELPLCTLQETAQLHTWNDTDKAFPKPSKVITLFEQQALKSPDKIALIFKTESLTYQVLNEKSNQLAQVLIGLKHPEKNPLIAISVTRSPRMIIGLLAILKVGGAYVPIDPNYPKNRLAHMFEDSQPSLLLTETSFVQQLAFNPDKTQVICLDKENFETESVKNIALAHSENDLAYVIYTSGSTGKPKGVMIEHAAFSNFVLSSIERYKINQEDRLLQFASISFDAAIEEIYPTLLQGATLVLRTEEMIASTETFLRQCTAYKLTILDLPTAYWQNLLTDAEIIKHHWPKSVRLVIIGGEAVSAHSIHTWLEHFGTYPALLNTYGPTEATVVASVFQFDALKNQKIYIGQPILNTKIHILDRYQRLLPPNTAGELCISGQGLARGYLQQPQLTADKFMTVAILGKMTRLYRTGDLAQWTPEGQLEYLGRIDNQVKLRGFRIELGEIETRLCQHSAVKEAIVLLQKQVKDKRLIAYITLGQNPPPPPHELRQWLKETLPDYMIPAQIMSLSELPMTPNGKVDHNALLLSQTLETAATEKSHKQPETLTEELLARIWTDLLALDKPNTCSIDIHDDFFAMGGHSLIAAQLIAHIQKTFEITLPLVRLFENPTIASLAKCIDNLQEKTTEKQIPWSAIVPFQLSGDKKPLFIIPGGAADEGEMMNLVKLVYLLGKERPIYGLRARGWKDQQQPYASVPAMAKAYIDEIQTIQPTGSYLLVGECLGGRVMIEVAHQLHQQGKMVEDLFLIETILHSGGETFLALINNIIVPKLKRQWQALRKMSIEKRFSHLNQKLSRLLRPKAIKNANQQDKPSEIIEQLQQAHENKINRYQPPIHKGNLTFLVTKNLLNNPPNSNWNSLATGKVTLIELPSGTEHTAYLGEQVKTTASRLKYCLDKV